MNPELVTALESAVSLLAAWENKSGSPTVDYEITTGKGHVRKAIDWEKARPEIEEVKP